MVKYLYVMEVDILDDGKNFFCDNFNDLKVIALKLEKRGFDPIKQISGYLLSGDPGYITNKDSARKILCKYDRNEIIEFLLKEYIK